MSFIVFTTIAAMIRPVIFTSYFIEQKSVFDGSIYLNIATKGYDSNGVSAFYPLWPMLIKPYNWMFGSEIFLPSALTALAFFFCSIYLLHKVFSKLFTREITTYCLLLYTLNPNAVFNARPYAEALFSLLATIFILLSMSYLKDVTRKKAIFLFVLCFFMSLCRPILLQFIGAFSIASILIFLFQKVVKANGFSLANTVKLSVVSLLGTIAGYLPYGYFSLQRHGSFFMPFEVQKDWGRKLGLHWDLFTKPRVISGSDNILVWDIQGFYLPAAILFLTIIYFLILKKEKPNKLPGTKKISLNELFIIWFAVLFAGAHSGAAFLTYSEFMSLGRHVFSNPFIYLGIGLLLSIIKTSKAKRFALGFYLFASIIYFGDYWSRYGRGSWMG